MLIFRKKTLIVALLLAACAQPVFAMTDASRQSLSAVYEKRTDLQRLFRATDWIALGGPATRGIADLEDWARQYGWKEHPSDLASYAPQPTAAPWTDVVPKERLAKLKRGAAFNFRAMTANAVIVIDDATGDVLLARNSYQVRPIASITKLMTSMVALDARPNLDGATVLDKADNVGGVRLAAEGYRFGLSELLQSTLIGSTNNTATAIPRACGMETADFVKEMNDKAVELGLKTAKFVEPSGLELGNVANARDVAAMAHVAFDRYQAIRQFASTATLELKLPEGYEKQLNNTNDLLTNPNNGIYVLGGKTGYLNESQWNLAVKLNDGKHPTLLVVLLGSDTKTRLFREAKSAALWTWNNYSWPQQ